ncbi:MAG: hypothetical protein QG635_1525 [Bacteroidota bacterium]|nr:hypothetical protein [Bacteroidota bacterium]
MIRNKRMLLVLLSVLLVMMINQANGQFGKNKVQYRTFEWKYIESKHFDI